MKNFLTLCPKEEKPIKKVKSYDDKTINAYMVSEKEAEKLKTLIR